MSTWERVSDTVAREFSDLAELEHFVQAVVRLLLATVLGGILGLQREREGKPAGIRTHMLVAAGSALFVLVPLQAGMDHEGLSRVLQGLLAGIGFLCAGSILKLPNEEQVHGLTTAAGIWMTAAIGVVAGLGREATAVLATVLVLCILLLERPFQRLGLKEPDKDTKA